MKQLITILMACSISVSLFPTNGVVYSENFENATVTATTLGNGAAMNYGGGAAWTFALEENYPIAGTKSAYFNITNPGTDWWTLQYRIDSKFAVKEGVQYKVSFKIQSSVVTEIKFKVEATTDFTQILNLKGGYTIEEYSIITSAMDRDGDNSNFMFAFGSPAVPAEIWIDDIVIEELGATGLDKNTFENVKVWSEGNKLIIDSPELYTFNVFNTAGQTIFSNPQSISGKTSLDIVRNDFVFVKLTSVEGFSKTVKIQMH
ncbi:MAG: hypothetical protein PHO94_13130 [Petrimonas sp.]|nr:hypothetical protein [Petrimonas sp.]